MTKTKERVYAERQDNYKQKKEVIFEEARKVEDKRSNSTKVQETKSK